MHQINVNEAGNYAASNAELGVQLNRARTIWHAYLKGQLANVGKAALWWSTFGIIAVSMLGSDIALAATRGPFNLALLLSSPLAAAAAEKWSIKRLLLLTTSGRFLIWTFLIPSTWIIFSNFLEWRSTLWVLFISFMFFDGIQVAFSNAVDIDCGGLDSLSSAYDLPLTDFLRYRFTTVHQLVFDSSFILFTPPTVLGLVLISEWLQSRTSSGNPLPLPLYITGNDISIFVLTAGVALVFGLLSLLSLRYYLRGIPSPVADGIMERQGLAQSLQLSADGPARRVQWTKEPSNLDSPSMWTNYKSKMAEIADGFFIVMSDSCLKWRLVMLAAETALEDTMVSVIIPMTALHSTSFLGHTSSKTVAALISVIIIAVGKLGGVLAGVYLASSWNYDTTASTSGKRLFDLVLFSSLSLMLVPLGFGLASEGLEASTAIQSTLDMSLSSIVQWLSDRSGILGCIILLAGVFLFFIFSTAPKIGFASLIQTLVTHEDDVAKVFGFVGMFVTITDGLMITIINLILYWVADFRLGLWIVFAVYASHGLLEYAFGTKLIQDSPTLGNNRIRSGLAYTADYD